MPSLRLFSILLTVLFLNGSAQATASVQCDRIFQKDFHAGPIPEFSETSAVVLSYFEASEEVLKTHQKIVENLPKNVQVLILLPQPQPMGTRTLMTEGYKKLAQTWKNQSRIQFLEVPLPEDGTTSYHGNWTRDFLPAVIQLPNGSRSLLSARYGYTLAQQTQRYFDKWMMSQNFGLSHKLNFPANSLFDWGNFSTDGKGNLFISKILFKKNAYLSTEQMNGWVRTQFGDSAQIQWIDPVPRERTGHVDMYLKFLDENRVLVAKTNLPLWGSSLNSIARQLESLGKKVIRIEMAIHEDEEFESRPVPFRSYTNSLIVGNKAFVPIYHSDGLARRTPLRQFDLRAIQIYKDLGYEVIEIPSAQSIKEGGAVHCLTSTIPKI